MYKSCVSCKKSRKDAIMYHFPASEHRLNVWLKCLKRDDLYNLSRAELSNRYVCEDHFEKRFITEKFRLISKAYPSLFTDDEIAKGEPCLDIENKNPEEEHNYARKRHFDHTYCRRKILIESSTSVGNILRNLPATSQAFKVPDPSTSSLKIVEENIVTKTSETVQDQESSTSLGINLLRNLPSTSQAFEVPEPSTSSLEIVDENIVTKTSETVQDQASKQRASKKRLVQKVSNLSPTSRLIYAEYLKAKQQLNFTRRAKRALKFCKEVSFQKLTKNFNPFAKKLFQMQVNLSSKKNKGRRFSTEEKLIALSIMKQSPKCYRFLQKIFILPSRSTLNKMIAKFNMNAGINPQLFSLLQKEVTSWNEKKKLCSIIFDEVALDTALSYDKNKDLIHGFVELTEKRPEFADHALVFLLRGAVYKWQQPIAFYYCQGSTAGIELKNILTNIISAVKGCGLKPIALICDQGAAFQSALHSLRKDTEREQTLSNQVPDGTVTIDGINMNIIYDPCHLIKGIRNNFLNKNISIDGKISKWSDIIDVYKTDFDHTEVRLLHKLNDTHVIPEKIKKMKVQNCVRVFSNTVAAALKYTAKYPYYPDGRPVSATMKNTSEVVMFFDKLFDSLNGSAVFSKKSKGKILRTAVTQNSRHVDFWTSAIKMLEKIKFVDLNGRQKSVPSLKNFILTVKSFMKLWQFFKTQNIKIMRPRFFNSDPIENFFGQVRAYNYRNNNPNCYSFNCTFKSLLITRIIKFHDDSFNCEEDPADQVINLCSLFNEKSFDNVRPGPSNSLEIILEKARRERINVHSRAYTAGWVVRKIFEKLKVNCIICKNNLMSSQSDIHEWISQREFDIAKNRLNYPSEGAVRCFGTVTKETNEYLEQKPHDNFVAQKVKSIILSKYSFDFIDCTEHRELVLNYFIEFVIRFAIINWCSIINKILNGTDVFRIEHRKLPNMQKKAYKKFCKKLKNKHSNK